MYFRFISGMSKDSWSPLFAFFRFTGQQYNTRRPIINFYFNLPCKTHRRCIKIFFVSRVWLNAWNMIIFPTHGFYDHVISRLCHVTARSRFSLSLSLKFKLEILRNYNFMYILIRARGKKSFITLDDDHRCIDHRSPAN